MATEPARVEANRLYWETDAPVSNIADQLGLSRRALYELLEPLPVAEACATCGATLAFLNRLARSSGEAVCGSCGAQRVMRGVPEPATAATESPAPVGVVAAAGDPGDSRAPSDPHDSEGPRLAAGRSVASDRDGARAAPPELPPMRAPAPGPRIRRGDYVLALAAGMTAALVAALIVARRRR